MTFLFYIQTGLIKMWESGDLEQHLGFESSTDSFAGPKSRREDLAFIHFTFIAQNDIYVNCQ
jgi:hypothetical protein